MKKWITITLFLFAIIAVILGVTMTFSTASDMDMKGMLAVGERYLSEERYEEAVELFSKVIDVEPKNTTVYIERAAAYIALAEPEKALDDLRKAIEVEPDQQETLQPKIDILTGADEVNNSDNKGTELSSDELKKFETLLNGDNSNDNNCFLTCLYDRPEQMDPNEIFYSALTVLSQVAEADKAEARSLDGMSEVPEWAPINKLTRVDADAFLKRFAGMTLAQLDKKMGEGENSCFVYSQKMDAYYIVRTDTNRVSMKVQYGYVRGSGIYTIGYTASYIGTTVIQENQLVEVSFRMVDDAPVFISNKLTENKVSSTPAASVPTAPSASSAPAVTTSSNYYAAYAPILKSVETKYEYGKYLGYSLDDFNRDGVKELFVEEGNGEADYIFSIYTIENGAAKYLGNIPGGHSSLGADTSGNVYICYGHMGGESVSLVTYDGNSFSEQQLFSKQLSDSEDYDYSAYCTLLPYAEVTDYSLLN